MTVSMRVMSAGDGYRYLLRSVAAADGDRSLSTPLTRYYSANGTPPGRWMGNGLRSIGECGLAIGSEVTAEHLQLLIGSGRDPITGTALGRAYPAYLGHSDRSTSGIGGLSEQPAAGSRLGAAPSKPGEEDVAARRRRAVAGYDFTFSIPKSASVLWGIADAQTQAKIADAHHDAVTAALSFLEREVAATRTGASGVDGAIAQVDVRGIIAAAFDHFDSRAGDPHLHTHVVISNKVQTVLDGRWRSLDGRPMHAAVVALSELHEGLFADAMTRALGVQWEMRERGRDRHPAWAIDSVPEALVAEFSTRSRHIDVRTDALISEYVTAHGRRPNPTTIMKLRAQATISTRPAKEVHSLAELTAEWRDRAERLLGADAASWVSRSDEGCRPVVRSADMTSEAIDALGVCVMTAVSEKRATWRHWNLVAESARQSMRYRFASASEREEVVDRITAAAERASLQITPPELAISPPEFQRNDGTSVFRPKHSAAFTSKALLDAEARLLARADRTSGPRVEAPGLRAVARVRLPGGGALTVDQAEALGKITQSGRLVDVLVGPAGAGKTTAMAALRYAWESVHGAGAVIGLAPSAAAAQVLAEDLGIGTENLAKWWQNHLTHASTFRANQLVIIDEASLAGTLPLDRITAIAADAGAKVLLVGDHAQLQSVDAGGAFSLLVHHRSDPPELSSVHRFQHAWEKEATLGLRDGDPEIIDVYAAHDRVRGGSTEAMADAAFAGWREDARAGKATVLISNSSEAVTFLNQRARSELVLEGRVNALREVALQDGAAAGVGDIVITRQNDRQLRAGHDWVRNGDRWVVTAVGRRGALEVRRQGRRWGSAVVLPAEYARQHVELGYAVTSYRAQGLTTDTAHVVAAPGMTRENLYVAMTRGRESNIAYVATDQPDSAHAGPRPSSDAATAESVLHGVLQHVGAERSAHETVIAEQDAWGSIAQLAAEYETIAAAAQRDRWRALVRGCGLTDQQAADVLESAAFGPLTAELRRAEAYHLDPADLMKRVVRGRGFEDAQDTRPFYVPELVPRRRGGPAPVLVEGRHRT
ncbi:MobF family relaxase [Planctomonas deserti]|uniref:MobF family relaxase n=1 Tax=Planctomonas deserti TaxID=2144185 RepID=UPI0027D280AE|nr:MobF family relaxase [Planctomonas deserti]